jgi:hypothetical protein
MFANPRPLPCDLGARSSPRTPTSLERDVGGRLAHSRPGNPDVHARRIGSASHRTGVRRAHEHAVAQDGFAGVDPIRGCSSNPSCKRWVSAPAATASPADEKMAATSMLPEQPTALLRRQTLQVLCGTPTSQKKNVTVPVGDSDMSPRSANNHSNATKARSSRRPH